MPRNGTGSYSLPEAAFTPNTSISSSAVNSDLSDIGSALTASLARDGQGGMTAVLPLDSAGFTYTTDPDTGIRRTGSNTQAVRCGGVDVVTATPTGVDFPLDVTQGGTAIVPVGTILPFAGPAAPAGFLLCYGQAISRTTYYKLFTVISGYYGPGDGSTTFNVPDCRGRVVAGLDNMGGTAANRLTPPIINPDGNSLGAAGGSQQGGLSAANLPAVSPTFSGTNDTVTVVTNESNIVKGTPTLSAALGAATYGLAATPGSGSASSQGSFTPRGTISQLGSGAAFNITQPTILVNYIIKT